MTPFRSRARRGLVAAALVAAGSLVLAAGWPQTRPPAASGTPGTQDALFQTARVWSAHLTFSAADWKAMQPANSSARGYSRSGEWLQGAPGRRNGWGSANGVEFHYAHGTLEFAGRTFPDAGVRFKGNGTYLGARGSKKFSLKVDLNKYVKGQNLAGLTTLNFHNSVTDPGFMNESVAYRLYREAGVPAPRSSFARVYVTVAGQFTRRYLGLYAVTENVDQHFFQARGIADVGAIIKPVTIHPFDDLGSDWARYVQTYDPKTDLTDAEQQRIIAFCRFVTHATDADFAAHIGEYIDVAAFVKYYAVLVWINNIDSLLDLGQNFYMRLDPKTRAFTFVPWDQDHSFGGFNAVRPRDYANGSITTPYAPAIRFLERMHAIPAFRTAYLARLRELTATVFQPRRFAREVEETAATIRPVVKDEPALLSKFEAVAAGRTGLLPFIEARTRSVARQLAAIDAAR